MCAKDFQRSFVQYPPKIPALADISTAFFQNLKRIESLGALPIYLVGAAALSQACDHLACANLKISHGDTRYVHGHADFDAALDKARQQERKRLMKEHYDNAHEGKAPEPFSVAEMNLSLMLSGTNHPIAMGADAILSGMVIGGWTAFETLATDLWKEALNLHPKTLSQLNGKWRSKTAASAEIYEDDESPASDKKISLGDLYQNDYDLSKCMGTVLRRHYRWSTLSTIREAYGEAFSKDFDDIKSAIEHPSIDALGAARNVLVHKAGIVDKEFKKQSKDWPQFAHLAENQPLELNGAIVRDLLEGSLGNTISLLKSIDTWLLSH